MAAAVCNSVPLFCTCHGSANRYTSIYTTVIQQYTYLHYRYDLNSVRDMSTLYNIGRDFPCPFSVACNSFRIAGVGDDRLQQQYTASQYTRIEYQVYHWDDVKIMRYP